MPRSKKSDETVEEDFRSETIHTPITKLTVDYHSEGLNDIARKINEIIDNLNGA